MFKMYSLDMFGLPPIRGYANYMSESEIPSWILEDGYENCSGGLSWLSAII